jgi:hypothetical protein
MCQCNGCAKCEHSKSKRVCSRPYDSSVLQVADVLCKECREVRK